MSLSPGLLLFSASGAVYVFFLASYPGYDPGYYYFPPVGIEHRAGGRERGVRGFPKTRNKKCECEPSFALATEDEV